ncbi:MAG: DNA repair protein RecN [SAR324 cluster bacterium]|nr:DNA repair protein RecN [SAR324 cluster bacterium]MBL7035304.1 DNA repair protein RecN [SAR324 cluster bacterium]
MLLQLRIENLATIRELEVEFAAGFSILTGETGAGKSIMIDAILLVLGQRADPGMIRTGKEKAVVEAVFSITNNTVVEGEFNIRSELENAGISLEDELIIRCLISRKGRQKRFINGVSVTVDFLKRVGRQLINIHGQHDNQSLLQVTSHLEFLDGFGDLGPLRREVHVVFQTLQEAKKEQKILHKIFAERTDRVEKLREIIEDLSELNMRPAEESELRKEENRLNHVEKLSLILGQVLLQLQENDGSVLEQLELLRKLISEAEQFDPECAEIRSGIETALFQLEDSHRQLVQYSDKVEDDPTRLAWINERLSRIQHFERIYQLNNSADILDLLAESKQELISLEHLDENEQEISLKIELLSKELQELAERLSLLRHQAAQKMDKAIVAQLQQLGMLKACFETQIVTVSAKENGEAISSTGIDRVEFLLSVNPGQAMRSLVKVASGGELSRIMLALKTVMTTPASVDILIFDEIDAGISGGIAEIVGEKLHSLGAQHQTLCVTHLPQIAAFAEQHYLVSKHLEDSQTYTKIKELKTNNERVSALADLIGGQQITEHTLKLAHEMLHNFQSGNSGQSNIEGF